VARDDDSFLVPIGLAFRDLVREHNAEGHVRQRVHEWTGEVQRKKAEASKWEAERRTYFLPAANEPRLLDETQRPTEPPDLAWVDWPNSEWDDNDPPQRSLQHVSAWAPARYDFGCRPEWDYPLPVPVSPVSLAAMFAAFTAIHDSVLKGEKIDPYPDAPPGDTEQLLAGMKESIHFLWLRQTKVPCIPDDDVDYLQRWLKDVRADIKKELGDPGSETGRKSNAKPAPKPKRSTVRGEGRAKLIAALTKHHEYANGGCLNLEPIGNNELARLADVDRATASAFFKREFKGHGKYKVTCADSVRLVAALKMLNGEYAPHYLYGSKPTDEHERDDE